MAPPPTLWYFTGVVAEGMPGEPFLILAWSLLVQAKSTDHQARLDAAWAKHKELVSPHVDSYDWALSEGLELARPELCIDVQLPNPKGETGACAPLRLPPTVYVYERRARVPPTHCIQYTV